MMVNLSHHWVEPNNWYQVLFVFGIPIVSWIMLYVLLSFIRGSKKLIILSVLTTSLIQIASPVYAFVYLLPKSMSSGHVISMAVLIGMFFVAGIALCNNQIIKSWLGSEENIKRWLEIPDGKMKKYLASKSIKIFAILVEVSFAAFYIGIAIFIILLFMDRNYSFGLYVMASAGFYLMFHIFILRYFKFTACKNCRRLLPEIDKSKNYKKYIRDMAFNDHFNCIYCCAHYYFSKDDLEKAKIEEKMRGSENKSDLNATYKQVNTALKKPQ
ncbi:hypothetical protein [Piscirickettsia litoralis]|uniref:MFS transporter n=1 Tax=Piscirickettsia litoralis TaxID=1891921 RepID=A0ABX3A810_9GAMM|nr:hypothetical protein [Piscirickettsia litoralis]ODN43685.1 hypothetical protein BGC07_13220 [Piscirickettsia litoralis]